MHTVDNVDNFDNVDNDVNVDNVDNVLCLFWGNLKQYQAIVDKISQTISTHSLSNIIPRDDTSATKNAGSIFSNKIIVFPFEYFLLAIEILFPKSY